MIIALFIGALLGMSYAWAAHQHHRLLFVAGGDTPKVFWVLSTVFRLACMAGIVTLLLYTTGTFQSGAMTGLVAGYLGVMIWLNRR